MCQWLFHAGECAFSSRNSAGILILLPKKSYKEHGEWKPTEQACLDRAKTGQHCHDTVPSYEDITRDMYASTEGPNPVIVAQSTRVDENGRPVREKCAKCRAKGNAKAR
jgi:hypothetical protein